MSGGTTTDSIVTLSPANIFGTPSSFMPATSYKMLLENFGTPDSPNPITPDAAANRNLRPDDIIGQYVNRELVMVSDAITAAVLNDRASIMTEAIFPKIETLETSFSVSSMEPNNIPYSRVTNFGIPREVSHIQYAEAYTTQRKKQMCRIELNFLLDPNFGPQYIRMLLSTLASNAKLTLNIEAITQATEQPYRNQFYQLYKREKLDHNRLFNEERSNYGLANRDHQLFFNDLIKFSHGQIEFPFDTILGPEGTFARLRNGVAENGGQVDCERVEFNAETKKVQSVIYKSSTRSSARFGLGGRNVELIEIPMLRVNTRDRTEKVYKPFVTTTTVCDVIPFDAGTPTQAIRHTSADALDVFAYSMSSTNGRQERLEFVEALKSTFLYDTETGEPSPHYMGFVKHMNASIKAKRISNPADSAEWKNARSANDENNFGTDKFEESMVSGKKNLNDMKGWRDTFFALTYDPVVHQYRLPKHLADFHIKQLKSERMHRAAKAALLEAKPSIGTTDLDELVNYILTIRRQPYTAAYVEALLDANMPYQIEGNSRYLGSEHRNSDDRIPQLAGNEYHSLRLPDYATFAALGVAAPAGFHSWAGLQTIAAWDTVPNDKFVQDARRHVNTLEELYRHIREHVPQSELVDGANTAPWWHGDDGGRSVLLDALVQLKTDLPRVGPVFVNVGAGKKVKKASERLAQLNILDNPSVEQIRTAVDNGAPLDVWLELGSRYSVDALSGVLKIATALDALGRRGEPSFTISRGATSAPLQVTPAKAAENLSAAIRNAIAQKSIADNEVFIAQAAVVMDKAGGNDSQIGEMFVEIRGHSEAAATASTSSGSGKGKKASLVPVFLPESRKAGLEKVKSSQRGVSGFEEEVDMADGQVIRAPLLESEIMPNGSGVVRGDKSQGYRVPLANAAIRPINAPVQSTDIASSVVSLAQGFKASSTSSSTYAPRAPEPSVYTPSSTMGFADALRSAATFGAVDRDSMDWISSQSSTSASQVQTPPALLSGPGGQYFFGPWQRRLQYLRTNVPDLLERLFTLSIFYARNNLFTHIALAKIGCGMMRMDGWRTGITGETAALIRLVRGSRTGFSVVSRISVRPGLEPVIGDYNVTAEMFHGVVFPNRQNIDIKVASMLIQFKYGRTVDFMTNPNQMQKSPGEVPAVLVMPDSAENYRREYPAQLFNDNLYYSNNSATFSPFRKHGYASWAQFVLGADMVQQANGERQRFSYWNIVPRSFVGDRACIYTCGDHGRFDVLKEGTGALGDISLNFGDAYKGFNGGMFPARKDAPLSVS